MIDYKLLDSWLRENKDKLVSYCQSEDDATTLTDVFTRLRIWEQEDLEQDLYRLICKVDSPPRVKKKSKVRNDLVDETNNTKDIDNIDIQVYDE